MILGHAAGRILKMMHFGACCMDFDASSSNIMLDVMHFGACCWILMILKKMLDFDDFGACMLDFDDFGACCWILMILKKHA